MADVKYHADSVDGRTLIALRAGPMTNSELYERFHGVHGLSRLVKLGLVELCDTGYRLTEAGRAACPLRNPFAATVAQAPAAATHSRQARPAAFSPIAAKPFSTTAGTPSVPETKGEQNVETASLPGIDQVRQLLASVPEGIKRATLMRNLSLSESQIDNALHNLCKAGEAERAGYGIIKPTPKLKKVGGAPNVLSEMVAAIDDVAKKHQAAKPTAPEPQQAQPKPATPAAEESGDVDFAIHADGRLTIIDGSQTFTLNPKETRRLGVFLGLFDCDLITQRLADSTASASA